MTYARLWEQGGRYAAGLARAGIRAGDKVCLIYPTCAEFFYTFFGCAAPGRGAGAALPHARRGGDRQDLPRLRGDGGRHHRLVPARAWTRARPLAPNVRMVLEPQRSRRRRHPAGAAPRPGADDLAFIQYTSGSTGQPRGVDADPRQRGGHRAGSWPRRRGITGDDRVVSWLPLYHDMGLIGCSFTPPLTATPIWLLPPDLRNPRAVARADHARSARRSRSRPTSATATACATSATLPASTSRRSRPALSGAEPVRPSTIEAFESHFGLKHVIAPCYGLAEATLAVAIWPRDMPLRLDELGALPLGGPAVPRRGGAHPGAAEDGRRHGPLRRAWRARSA